MILLQLIIYLYKLNWGKMTPEKHFTHAPFYGSVDPSYIDANHFTRL